MPEKYCDPKPRPIDSAFGDRGCPKCGVEMEQIESGAEGPPLQQLQLCPVCYLVTWEDNDGFQVRQGVPMKRASTFAANQSGPLEPREC